MNVNHTIRLSIIFCFIVPMSIMEVFAQESDSFEAYQKKAQQDFDSFRQNMEQEYAAYAKKQEEDFRKFKERIAFKWGKENVKTSGQYNWVDYSANDETRTNVDFEKGEAEIEILIPKEKAKNPEEVKKRINKGLQQLASAKGDINDFEQQDNKAVENDPIMNGLVQMENGKFLMASNAAEFSGELMQSGNVQKKNISTDSTEWVQVSIKFPLAPDYLQKRILKYYGLAQEFAQKNNVALEHVLAVIHTESCFNPKARSHVPAYGLMQIVPSSAGKDAFKYLYKKDSLLTAEYLYVPKNNLELGVAYLRLLMRREFRNVSDDRSRLLCASAAYNTGAGNVSRAITGKKRVSDAIDDINAYTYEELYDYLCKNLPYEETRKYIRKINERRKIYESYKVVEE